LLRHVLADGGYAGPEQRDAMVRHDDWTGFE